MLSATSLRITSSLRQARLTANRLCVVKAVTCSELCFPIGFHTNQNNLFSGGLVKERGLCIHRNPSFSSRSCSTTQVKLNCWNCKRLLDKTPLFFCDSCKAIQPPQDGTSYFSIMGCDNTFTLDTQKLQTRYLQLQRFLHPDNFSQKSMKEQKFSESQSALVNKAYKTLLKPLSRGLYMLELKGMRLEEGTDSEADPDFLMKLMEINETLDEAKSPEEVKKIGQEMTGKLAGLTERIDAALHKGRLHDAKGLLTQMKYYANIEEKVKEKLSGFM